MATTIKDVAKAVGVTATTVSMVMRGDPRISEKTREKVVKAARDLNYYPNHIGRSLVRGKTNAIAVASTMFYGPFKIDLLNGIDSGVMETDYNVQIISGRPDKDSDLLKEIIYGRRADGVIAVNLNPDKETLKAYKDLARPIVFVEQTFEGFPGVKGDSYKGAYMAAERFAKTGRKKIGVISGAYKHLSAITDRDKGFADGLKANGLEINPKHVLLSKNYNFDEGKDFCKRVVEEKWDIDAIFSIAGDLVAMGFMKQARDSGVKMPDDIAIIGYDGLDTGSLMSPALTTLKQQVVYMGREAFEMLRVHMANKDAKPEIKVFEPSIIIRESA